MAERHPLRVVSWNVNGLRAAAKKGFARWLATSDAWVVGLQETRTQSHQVPPELLDPPGWTFHLRDGVRAGYAGVGLYCRVAPDELVVELGHEEMDGEGRLQLARFGRLWIANVYFPNGSGKERDNSRVPFKLEFYQRLFSLLEPLRRSGEPVLVMGDFNTAHRHIDLARPKANEGTSGFLPEEREELDRWLRSGWTDTFRRVHGDVEGAYTWWSQRFGVREKNVGWRIDYVLASPAALQGLRSAAIHPEVQGSDHCPVSVELEAWS